MRKRFCFLFIICIFIFTMIGCGNEIPEMSEEESAMVSNYAATLLLKYDANYQIAQSGAARKRRTDAKANSGGS